MGHAHVVNIQDIVGHAHVVNIPGHCGACSCSKYTGHRGACSCSKYTRTLWGERERVFVCNIRSAAGTLVLTDHMYSTS